MHGNPPEKADQSVTQSVHPRIAEELGVAERQVRAAVELLDGGATVPFIARYRKEATGLLDDAQLRTLEERRRYLREVDERRAAGAELGPLAGVPLAHKDVFTTAAMPTTAGSKILEGWRPPYDATVTARLRQAGLVILG